MTNSSHRISNKSEDDHTGTCSVCGPVTLKPRKRSYGILWACPAGAEFKPDTAGGGPSKRIYNARAAILGPHRNECDLCGKPMLKPVLDHDHLTGDPRGWLCHGCNTGLGQLGDSIAGLERAIMYLRGVRRSKP